MRRARSSCSCVRSRPLLPPRSTLPPQLLHHGRNVTRSAPYSDKQANHCPPTAGVAAAAAVSSYAPNHRRFIRTQHVKQPSSPRPPSVLGHTRALVFYNVALSLKRGPAREKRGVTNKPSKRPRTCALPSRSRTYPSTMECSIAHNGKRKAAPARPVQADLGKISY